MEKTDICTSVKLSKVEKNIQQFVPESLLCLFLFLEMSSHKEIETPVRKLPESTFR